MFGLRQAQLLFHSFRMEWALEGGTEGRQGVEAAVQTLGVSQP